MRSEASAQSGRKCRLCSGRSHLTSAALGVCGACIRDRPGGALQLARAAHTRSRHPFGLPEAPPRSPGGTACPLCERYCWIGEGERGFCGLRTVRQGRIVHLAGTPRRGLLQWYRDPLPTNCVAAWVCPANRQSGRHNLAVFYTSCGFNCLFCQNWHFRRISPSDVTGISSNELAEVANSQTFCACFFGGDPSSQMPHALATARRLAARGITVCWETAGASHPRLFDRALQLSLRSGGCLKIDLKAYDETLHIVLTGASNRRTLENFARVARHFRGRPEPPPLVASTLLVPGYVDAHEVSRIARFIAENNPNIPYALLGFSPQFEMKDLPPTSLRHALAAEDAALSAGLTNVRIGNRHVLGDDY